MRIDKVLKRLFVEIGTSLFRHHTLRKAVPRELVQFLFHKKGYTNFFPGIHLIEKTAVSDDPIRYAQIVVALEEIKTNQIKGSFAEVGVYKGISARYIHESDMSRTIYLFDTFKGFTKEQDDGRFADTSIDLVKSYIGSPRPENLIFRVGIFPETTKGLGSEIFSFVMVDVDKFEPTLEALKFFWPRVQKGGYLFVHDYLSPESNWGATKAVQEFFGSATIPGISLCDKGGTLMLKKT